MEKRGALVCSVLRSQETGEEPQEEYMKGQAEQKEPGVS